MKTHNLQGLMDVIRDWSDKQFSEGVFTHERAIPIAHHLKKEVDELIAELRKVGNAEPSHIERRYVQEEFADCLMLLLDCASHFGFTADELYRACVWKLKINMRRKWGSPDENGVIEHIK